MGFYSFYRIFKDIIKSLFGNKAWRYTLIIALIVVFFTLFSVKSNASDLRPWNVYTNTTEFNWARVTDTNFHNYPNNLSYKIYELDADETYYLYNPNSNTGSLHYFCYSSNDVNRPLILIQDTQYNALHLDFTYELDRGYVDIPFNTLFSPQMSYYIFITDSCELYRLDDKYSNIETYNELSSLAVDLHNFLFGDELSVVNSSSIIDLAASYNGSFVTSNQFTTYYYQLKKGYKYNLSFLASGSGSSTSKDYLRFGFSSSIPDVGVSYTSLSNWENIAFVNSYDFIASTDTYFYVSFTNFFSNISLKSNYNSAQAGGINQQIINQGEETRETLTDSSISQNSSDYSLPTDSTNDITSSGFASIFDRIKNTFTSPTSTPIVIQVPFTGKTFTISKQTVYGSANLGIVQTLIECFWWYIIALFVCKDVFKKIEKLKTGNIEFTETTNIKEDIL